MTDYSLTTYIFSALPIFLIILIIIYRNKVKKVAVEFVMSFLIMLALLFVAGFAIAIINVSIWLLIPLLIGVGIIFKLGKLPLKETAFVVIFLLIALVYKWFGAGNALLAVFIGGWIAVMILNIMEVGKDESIPYKY